MQFWFAANNILICVLDILFIWIPPSISTHMNHVLYVGESCENVEYFRIGFFMTKPSEIKKNGKNRTPFYADK